MLYSKPHPPGLKWNKIRLRIYKINYCSWRTPPVLHHKSQRQIHLNYAQLYHWIALILLCFPGFLYFFILGMLNESLMLWGVFLTCNTDSNILHSSQREFLSNFIVVLYCIVRAKKEKHEKASVLFQDFECCCDFFVCFEWIFP